MYNQLGGVKLNQENKVKEWSNPTPAGLVALAVACFCFFAISLLTYLIVIPEKPFIFLLDQTQAPPESTFQKYLP